MLRGVTKTIKNGTKEQKVGYLGMLLGTLGARLLGNMLAGKGIVRAGNRNRKRKAIERAGYRNEMDFECHLTLWQTLKNISIIRMNLVLREFFQDIICLKTKDWAYLTNLDE